MLALNVKRVFWVLGNTIPEREDLSYTMTDSLFAPGSGYCTSGTTHWVPQFWGHPSKRQPGLAPKNTLYLTCDLMEYSAVPSNPSVPKVTVEDVASSPETKKALMPRKHVQLCRMQRTAKRVSTPIHANKPLDRFVLCRLGVFCSGRCYGSIIRRSYVHVFTCARITMSNDHEVV